MKLTTDVFVSDFIYLLNKLAQYTAIVNWIYSHGMHRICENLQYKQHHLRTLRRLKKSGKQENRMKEAFRIRLTGRFVDYARAIPFQMRSHSISQEWVGPILNTMHPSLARHSKSFQNFPRIRPFREHEWNCSNGPDSSHPCKQHRPHTYRRLHRY